MKILHLATHLNIGGITTYILKLIRPFSELGVETFIISSGGECTRFFHEKGAKTLDLPFRTKNELSPKLIFSIPKIAAYIRKEKIQVIHAHTRITQVMGAVLSWLTGIPMVTTCHGFYKRRLGRRLFPAWGKKVIAISDSVASHLTEDFKVSPSRIVPINNGVDLKEIDTAFSKHQPEAVKKKYGFDLSDPVIGIVARLVEDKGHEFLIRAVAYLRPYYPGLRLLIVGDGRYRPELEKLTKDLKLSDRVSFLGNINDVTEPLSAMDIFVLPATWREGFGLSIVEAMACYKPVIVSNIWSLNKLIEDRITGFLVEPRQVEALAEAIRYLLERPEDRKAMGARVRRTAETLFPIERTASEIKKVYEEVLA